MAKPARLTHQFFDRPVLKVAPELIGATLLVGGAGGVIVEVEAYHHTDPAAHSYGGRRTARNEITYAEGGQVYVFFVYGMYYQLNLVTGLIDHPHVVLIRAVEPVEGVEVMRERRGVMKDKNLTSGPGKLCIALGITRELNSEDLTTSERIWVEEYRNFKTQEIMSGPRVGIDYAEEFIELPWRFWLKGNSFVSKTRRS